MNGMTEGDREVYLNLLGSLARTLKLLEDDKLARSQWADDLTESIVRKVSTDVVGKIAGIGDQLDEITRMLCGDIEVHVKRIDALETVIPRVEDLERKVEFLMRKVG